MIGRAIWKENQALQSRIRLGNPHTGWRRARKDRRPYIAPEFDRCFEHQLRIASIGIDVIRVPNSGDPLALLQDSACTQYSMLNPH